MESITIDRRAILSVAAGLAVATMTAGLAIAMLTPDPIHAAIERHRIAFAELLAASADRGAMPDGADDGPLYAALAVWNGAVNNLISVAPKTNGGLVVLEAYLDQPENAHVGDAVTWPWHFPDGTTLYCKGLDRGGPWLLARHAERLAG